MFKYYLALASLFLCVWTATAHAQNMVSLNDRDNHYTLAPYAFVASKDQTLSSTQDIISKYKSSARPVQRDMDYVQIDKTDDNSWIVFEINNETNKTRWTLDFGDLADGRSGIIRSLSIYDANSRSLIYNNNDEYRDGTTIPLILEAQSSNIIAISVAPLNYKNIHLPISIKWQESEKTILNAIYAKIFGSTNSVIMVILAISAIGLVISRTPGIVVVMFYYGMYLFWWYCIETPLLVDIPGLSIIMTCFPFLIGLSVGAFAFLTIPLRYVAVSYRYGLSISMMISTLIMVGLITFFASVSNLYATPIAFIMNVIIFVFSIFYLLRHDIKALKSAYHNMVVWIMLVATGQIVIFATNQSFLPASPLTIHADYFMMYPQLICVFIGVYLSIKHHHLRALNRVMQHSKKTQTLLDAKKTKESSDHSRLLRVIEREREIMEELRGRESERAEEMRQAKNQADEANNAKSAFLAVVSHEIRTPMTGVMGMVRLLENTPLSNDQKNYIQTIRDSGDAMVSLLNDILDFSKIQSGGMNIENIQFDLRRLANGVVMLMKGHADQRNINLILDYSEKLPHNFYGDPTRLRQILLNLLGNAMKFTSSGHVKLIIRPDERDQIYFAVEDTGIGISKEAQENLFQPFSQADSTISRKYGGTGLGLTICKKLIEAMGGEIEIESVESIGTTFFFSIPLQSASGELTDMTNNHDESTPVTVMDSEKRLKILVVDDNDVNLKVVQGFLDQAQHQSVTAQSGEQALQILNDNNDFDYLFLDIEMPNMNGVELASKILKRSDLANTPLIAMTGNVSEADIQKYMDAGFSNHLAKPITPEALFEILKGSQNVSDVADMSDKEAEVEATEIHVEPKDIDFVEEKQKPSAKKSPTASKTLDEAMIQGLKDGLGVAQTKSLLVDLFVKSDEILDQMNQALKDKSIQDMRDRAHELKGMAGNFGLKAVSMKAADIEKFSQKDDADIEFLTTDIKDLSTLVERSRLAIDDFVDE